MAKNLSDAIHGDRSSVRGGFKQLADDDWDEWDRKQAAKAYEPSYPATTGGKVTAFKSSFSGGERCYHKHPALKLPGTDFVIYGGSCLSPAIKDADVYIGFDSGMRFTQRHWPWKKGVEVLFEVQDMGVPKNAEEFRKLVGWTKKQVESGVKVHCGCIGGHGRTGMFFAALVSEFDEKDAIAYVRKNYCDRAVESSSQVNFLHDSFGVKKVGGSKSGSHLGSASSSHGKSMKPSKSKGSGGGVFTAIRGNGCIWDPPVS